MYLIIYLFIIKYIMLKFVKDIFEDLNISVFDYTSQITPEKLQKSIQLLRNKSNMMMFIDISKIPRNRQNIMIKFIFDYDYMIFFKDDYYGFPKNENKKNILKWYYTHVGVIPICDMCLRDTTFICQNANCENCDYNYCIECILKKYKKPRFFRRKKHKIKCPRCKTKFNIKLRGFKIL
jgi:hypothetical protein